MNQFAIGYHKSVKKILNVPYWESNHLVCEVAGLLTLDHHINLSKIKFMYRIFKFPPAFVDKNYDFIFQNSHLLKEVHDILRLTYGVDDLLSNDIDALKARVFFINNSYNDYMF